jgi:hypothetical protein
MCAPVKVASYLAGVALLLTEAGLCATVHVDCDNHSGVEDGSLAHPFSLISGAMNAASHGDSIVVMPGTYSELIYVDMHEGVNMMNCAAVVMKDGVALVSEAGPDSTAIESGGAACVYFDGCGEGTVLSGFRLDVDGYGWGLRSCVISYASDVTVVGNRMDPPYIALYARQYSRVTATLNVALATGFCLDSGSFGSVRENVVCSVFVDGAVGAAGPVTIESNLIEDPGQTANDTGVSMLYGVSGDVEVIDNDISGKDVGVKLCFGELHRNRFEGCLVNVEAVKYCSARAETFDATGNWWGTTDPSLIAAGILDCADDPEIPRCIRYEPWCLDPACTSSAASRISWGAIKALYR